MTEKLFKAQQRAFSLLQEKNLDTGAVRLLLQHITGKTQSALFASMQETLSQDESDLFNQALKKLVTGMPIQHLIGTEMFYGRSFEVNEHVLIPRPETEELIYYALEKSRVFFREQELFIADIGTGSGAIAITMKKELPTATVAAVDISVKALEVAKRNAERLEAVVDWRLGDLTEPLKERKWDIILSNPPYIAYDEMLEMSSTVVDYEPHTALFAEEDGLYFYRKLAEQLPALMKEKAFIGIEYGYAQSEAVYHLFQQAFPNAKIDIVQDINGKDRMLFCEIGA